MAEVLRSVLYDGIASWVEAPNPVDHNRPLVPVHLRHDQEIVRAALAGEPLPRKEPRTARPDFKFPIGTINGEPLFETLIRERR